MYKCRAIDCKFCLLQFIVENPLNSWLFLFPSIASALALTGAQRVVVHMGDFGGDSDKPLELWGTAPWLPQLQSIGEARRAYMKEHDLRPAKKVKLTEKKGRWVCGNENTEASQLYTVTFVRVVAELHRRYLVHIGVPQV